jgi:hypothetical protein
VAEGHRRVSPLPRFGATAFFVRKGASARRDRNVACAWANKSSCFLSPPIQSVIQRRKTVPEVKASGAEETVVLAFGGEGGNVCLTRKVRKGRPLYKINN